MIPSVGSLKLNLKVACLPTGEPEIFHTLQGEGASVGTPSVFLRLAQCNLACTWCDTKYTWDWKHYDFRKEVVEVSPEDIEREILKYRCEHLVITGGEPMLQQDCLAALVKSLRRRVFSFEVETNGTIEPGPEMVRDIDQWNVSPKLSTSGNSGALRCVPAALRSYVEIPHAYFKFVVTKAQDVEEVNQLIDEYCIPRNRVLLSPEGRTPAALAERSTWLSQVCVDQNLRFSPRIHIQLWGDARGK